MMDYLALPGFAPLATEEVAPSLPFSLALFHAIEKSRTFELVELGKLSFGAYSGEVLVVELSCDAVPTRNPIGIEYRERLAIVVRPGEASIPQVYPLRSNFPDVWHRNSPLPGFPPDLCLYFEPVRSTLRTFTPESFLKRIEWWVQATANETLHAADQPVEQLFFHTNYEVVLPFDYEARQQAGEPFYFSRIEERANRATTLVGAFHDETEPSLKPSAFSAFFQVDVPPTVHRAVEHSPTTLGELHDRMLREGIDLHMFLADQVRSKFPDGGAPKNSSPTFTTLLLRMPVLRELGGAVASIQYRALFAPKAFFALGKSLGALFEAEGKYFNAIGVLGSVAAADEWREVEIYDAEVLFQNDQASARRQSGFQGAGPKGTILGVGALGSAIYELWVRSGWGAWTVVDKDHVRPHNITRHTSTYAQVGKRKVDAVLERARDVAVGRTLIDGVEANVVEPPDVRLTELLTKSDIVVDITTTLDYPRMASTNSAYARHVSAFISPSGGDAVILAEDASRRTTLLSLEAQYYRAMISSDWGAAHLRNNQGTFWSGAGCRDISVTLPYASVLAHAATQSEQLMMLSEDERAAIRVWVRDINTGSVQPYTVPVEEQVTHALGSFTGYLDKGLEAKLFKLRDASLPSETGGVLLGFWDFNISALVVVDALSAPSDSVANRESFVRGTAGLLEEIAEVQRRTAGIVGYVGEWHSHPEGVRAQPSTDDLAQLATLAARMAEDGMPVTSLIVGKGEMKLMLGQVV
jgi:integrative and conjugative element protein (TIGR02256 family)